MVEFLQRTAARRDTWKQIQDKYRSDFALVGGVAPAKRPCECKSSFTLLKAATIDQDHGASTVSRIRGGQAHGLASLCFAISDVSYSINHSSRRV
jgi:hypothetical protein